MYISIYTQCNAAVLCYCFKFYSTILTEEEDEENNNSTTPSTNQMLTFCWTPFVQCQCLTPINCRSGHSGAPLGTSVGFTRGGGVDVLSAIDRCNARYPLEEKCPSLANRQNLPSSSPHLSPHPLVSIHFIAKTSVHSLFQRRTQSRT